MLNEPADRTQKTETANASRWHHSPAHAFEPGRAYFITAATLYKRHYFHDDRRLTMFQKTLFETVDDYEWRLEAWAIFSNHYHCIMLAPATGHGKNLKALIQRIHSQSARNINILDNAAGRRVWFQYRDTMLTYDKSYYARLNYTHHNAVKHGIVLDARQYPYCSAAWFEQNATNSLFQKISSFKWDTVNVDDDYDVEWRHP